MRHDGSVDRCNMAAALLVVERAPSSGGTATGGHGDSGGSAQQFHLVALN